MTPVDVLAAFLPNIDIPVFPAEWSKRTNRYDSHFAMPSKEYPNGYIHLIDPHEPIQELSRVATVLHEVAHAFRCHMQVTFYWPDYYPTLYPNGCLTEEQAYQEERETSEYAVMFAKSMGFSQEDLQQVQDQYRVSLKTYEPEA